MRRIRQSSQAWRDIVDAMLFIAEDNLSAADAMIGIIDRKLQMLAIHPELGQERSDLGDNLRCTTAGSYVLVYRATAEEIELVRVIHSARDIDALF
ncbi:MAG TPA: type II toxin-antitoxin system RelE/ParE family toxin [Pirellulales bacterium]|nr:type II toxin-antitoxin system RelE/ParE family toxin [Pirellulales bacterium]